MLLAFAIAVAGAAPSPSVVADAAKPLRTVVFHASYNRREELTIGHFSGGMGSGPGGQTTSTGDTGTITVDIYNVINGTVVAVVTERWNSQSSPKISKGAINEDGSLIGFPPEISAVTRALLPFFGTKFSPPGTDLGQVGATWRSDASPPDYSLDTSFTVKSITGELVTLAESLTATSKSPNAPDTTMTGTVAYKPKVLAPVSGDFRMRATKSDATSTDEINTDIHFARASDTIDSGG